MGTTCPWARWEARPGQDLDLKNVLTAPEPLAGRLVLFPGYSVWGYSGGGGVAALILAPKAGTQTVPWLLAAQPQKTGCPGAVREGEKQKTLGVSGQGYLHCSPGGV